MGGDVNRVWSDGGGAGRRPGRPGASAARQRDGRSRENGVRPAAPAVPRTTRSGHRRENALGTRLPRMPTKPQGDSALPPGAGWEGGSDGAGPCGLCGKCCGSPKSSVERPRLPGTPLRGADPGQWEHLSARKFGLKSRPFAAAPLLVALRVARPRATRWTTGGVPVRRNIRRP